MEPYVSMRRPALQLATHNNKYSCTARATEVGTAAAGGDDDSGVSGFSGGDAVRWSS